MDLYFPQRSQFTPNFIRCAMNPCRLITHISYILRIEHAPTCDFIGQKPMHPKIKYSASVLFYCFHLDWYICFSCPLQLCLHFARWPADVANRSNKINHCAGNKNSNDALNVVRLVVLPSTHAGSDKYMEQKMHDVIVISSTLGHTDIFAIVACNPYWPDIQNVLLRCQRAGDRPDPCDHIFRMKLKLLWTSWKKINL